MSENPTPLPESCRPKRQDITGISGLSWDSRKDLYGNYICHTFQGGSWADRSPLHEVAFHGCLLSLHTLIAQGFNVNITTMDGVSPLHDACLGGHVACAKVLLEYGADVNAMTINKATPLFNACCAGSADCVRLLLEVSPAPHPAHLVASPLHEAAKRGHRECLEILLANGVNIDLEIPGQGTPLFVACVSQKTNSVERLLQLAQGWSVRLLELLLEYGADGPLSSASCVASVFARLWGVLVSTWCPVSPSHASSESTCCTSDGKSPEGPRVTKPPHLSPSHTLTLSPLTPHPSPSHPLTPSPVTPLTPHPLTL
ncbi:hypothetical protein JZ751_005390 [Albula glossodonta]|uniref:Ankyrin repeat and SOCS box containing 11 n=1 Tax=Albula glossodonta TaxID=121402 RepID=A0A8T2MLW2_9TELE|nr:hypothetical protein JZ751_005390 [Albula glossodonta]